MDVASGHRERAVWRLAPGVALLGMVQDSGLTGRTFLVQRADGQVVQLSELLNSVLAATASGLPAFRVAADVSAACGRRLTLDGLEHVMSTKLEPLGLVVDTASPPRDVPPPRARPLLALRLRGTIVPAGAVRAIARRLAPVCAAPVVVAAVAALVVLDVALAVTADAARALEQTLVTPGLILALYGLLTAGALIHELGHATACRYGGAEPGRIGFGLYVVFPAFFTNVTDSYRLDRAGRLRTDLGGLYFNVWCVLAAGTGYLLTGSGMLLIVVIAMQLQMLQQLPPTIRLDGYFVLADLAGVPDLFGRVGPVIRSIIPGRPPDPRVLELRPAARRIVTGWVLIVIPVLVVSFGLVMVGLPTIVAQTWAAGRLHLRGALAAFGTGRLAEGVLSVLALILLVLPIVGVAVVLQRLLATAVRFGLSRRQAHRPTNPRKGTAMTTSLTRGTDEQAPVPAHPVEEPAPRLEDFFRARPSGRPAPAEQGWRGAIRHLGGSGLEIPPGRAELARRATIARIQATFDGPQTIVVINPKGGAHKTTATLLLAATFGIHRGGYTLAWDNNETRGTLGWRAGHDGHLRTTLDLLRELDRGIGDTLSRVGDLDRFVRAQGSSQFDVLASDEDAAGAAMVGADQFHRLHAQLCRFYRVIVIDTGNNMRAPNWEAAIDAADQLVIMTTAREDTAASAMWMVDGLRDKGHADKVANAVTVIAAASGRPDPRMTRRIRAHFERLTRTVVDVPHDPALVAGGELRLTALREATRDAWLDATAAVAVGLAPQPGTVTAAAGTAGR